MYSIPRAEISIEDLRKQRQWSGMTFGPGSRTEGIIDHMRKEFLEIEEAAANNDDTELEEWIDLVILALDGAWRTGADPSEIITCYHRKMEKNFNRKWPDWRTAEPGKAIEHDRSAE